MLLHGVQNLPPGLEPALFAEHSSNSDTDRPYTSGSAELVSRECPGAKG